MSSKLEKENMKNKNTVNNELLKIDKDSKEIVKNIDNFKNKIIDAASIEAAIEEIKTIKGVSNKLEVKEKEWEEEFNKYVNAYREEAKKEFLKIKQSIDDTLEVVKAKAIKEHEEKAVEKETFSQVVDEDGVVTTVKKVKVISPLPKGIYYTSGKISFDYKEEGLPDKFFKKTIKKTDVKKAIESGELSSDIMIPKRGEPFITINTIMIEKTLKQK